MSIDSSRRALAAHPAPAATATTPVRRRYDKHALIYRGGLVLPAILLWLG